VALLRLLEGKGRKGLSSLMSYPVQLRPFDVELSREWNKLCDWGVLNSIGISICKGIQVNMFFKKFVSARTKLIYCLGLGNNGFKYLSL